MIHDGQPMWFEYVPFRYYVIATIGVALILFLTYRGYLF